MGSLKVEEEREDFVHVQNDDYVVTVSENSEGIVVDVFFRDGDLIKTDCYWKKLDYPSAYPKDDEGEY